MNRRIVALTLTTCLVAVSLTGCGKDKSSISKEAQKSIDEMEFAMNALDSTGLINHSDTDGKEETVYVLMDANGGRTETIVSEWLKNPEGAENMTDTTSLDNLEVVKGNASFTKSDDGEIQWNTEGGDVYYQGKTDKDLPVDVSVKYTLDGKEVNGQDLKDVSGHVNITYNYTNKISKVMEIGNDNVSIYQPFTMVTGLLLDDKKVANVKVTDGKVINSGNYTVVLGIAMPGLSESLGIDKINEEKETDIKIPDSVTIEADVTDFTMPMSMTVATNDALSTLNLDGIDSMDDLQDKVSELEDGMNQIVDGADKLSDGMHELASGTTDLADGTVKLDDGAFDLRDGAHKLYDGTNEVNDGAGKLYDGTNTLYDGTKTLRDGVHKLNDKTPELADGVKQLKNGADELSNGIKTATGNNAALTGGATQIREGLQALSGGVDQIATGAVSLKSGASNLKAGAASAADNVDGIQAAASGIAQKTSQAASAGMSAEQAAQLVDLLNSIRSTVSGNEIEEAKANAAIDKAIEAVNGCATLTGAMSQVSDGAAQIAAGAGQISAGIRGNGTAENPGLVGGAAALEQGAGQVQAGAATLKDTGVNPLIEGAQKLEQGVTAYTSGISKISEGALKLKAGTDTLNGKVPELVDGVSALTAGADSLADGAGRLSSGAGDLYTGTGKLRDGARDLAKGTDDLKDGTFELRDGVEKLTEGVSQLVDGSGKLKDGVIEFDEEGIQKIADVIGNDVETYFDRMKAVSDFSKEYTSFSGAKKDESGSVKFIYKTDAVK